MSLAWKKKNHGEATRNNKWPLISSFSKKKTKVMESLRKENDSFRITSGFVSLSGCKEQKEELLRMRLQRMPGFSAQRGPYFSFHSLHAWTVRNFPFLESIRTKVHQAVVLPGRQGESPPAEHRCRQRGNLSTFTGRHLLSLTNWTSRSWYKMSTFCLQNIIYIKTKKRKITGK